MTDAGQRSVFRNTVSPFPVSGPVANTSTWNSVGDGMVMVTAAF